jgi:dTDP-4-amino-4,6-dideoxygalactose transaminase
MSATSEQQPKEARTPVPAPWPYYAPDEITAVAEVLRSGRVNQWTGELVGKFEMACISVFGQRHALALANGSLALELTLKAFGIGPGDEVIVTPRSFVASASCVDLVGATPVFADIDMDSQGITAETIATRITERTKAIIPVHLNGWPCDMAPIMELAEKRDLIVIEDCAQSHGATIDGRPAGSFGHAAAFSFCQDKIISTGGEGGMLLFADEAPARIAWSFRDHGKNPDKVARSDHPPGYRWLHDSVGTNWRMTEMQAAIGLVQLGKLPEWTAKRTANAERLAAALEKHEAAVISRPRSGMTHAYYRLAFRLDPARLAPGWDRDRVMTAFNEAGVPCFVGSCPELYREGLYRERNHVTCPQAKALGEVSLTLLVHPTLDDAFLSHCERVIGEVFGQASR